MEYDGDYILSSTYLVQYINEINKDTLNYLKTKLVLFHCNKNNKFGILYMYHIWFSSNW